MNTSKCDIYAIVLAAGSASRFGATKQLVEVNGVPLVRRATDAAVASCDSRVVLVVGHDWQAVSQAGLRGGSFMVKNDLYRDGLGSSIACGVRSLRHTAGAVLVLLADQPQVTADHLRALIEAWNGASNEIVVSAFDGTMGPPALFAHDCFEDLVNLAGDSGGKHLLSDPRFQTLSVRFDPAAIDIDTRDDLRQISRNARS